MFVLKDQDDKITAAVKWNIIIEKEKVQALEHWPTSHGCTDCCVNRALKTDLDAIESWNPPPNVVCDSYLFRYYFDYNPFI